MIICDACHANKKFSKNCFAVTINQTHETFHLCNECVERMKEAIFKPLPEPEPKGPKRASKGKRKAP